MKLRYRLGLLEDFFEEEDIFPPSEDNIQLIAELIVNPLNAKRKKLKEPPLSLLKVEILNPYVHQHSYRKLREDQFAGKVFYCCDRCGITAYRKTHIFTGETLPFIRDEAWKSEKFAFCHDPLKEMPKSTKLTFK